MRGMEGTFMFLAGNEGQKRRGWIYKIMTIVQAHKKYGKI
jgi:hypothetical protein